MAKDLPVPTPDSAPSTRTGASDTQGYIAGYSHGCWEAEPRWLSHLLGPRSCCVLIDNECILWYTALEETLNQLGS